MNTIKVAVRCRDFTIRSCPTCRWSELSSDPEKGGLAAARNLLRAHQKRSRLWRGMEAELISRMALMMLHSGLNLYLGLLDGVGYLLF
jgi:hypothetical protein